MKHITTAYIDNALDLEAAIKRTRRLLGQYRSLAWLHRCTATPTNPSVCASESAHAGARYLSALACGGKPEMHVDSQTIAFVVNLMHHILEQVGAYPTHGDIYHHILTQSYFVSPHQSDETTMEELHLERSVYYSYKREAIAIFGLVLISTLSVLDVNASPFAQRPQACAM